ncbi:MAG: YceD family protein [Vicinamibacterales bacterium]
MQLDLTRYRQSLARFERTCLPHEAGDDVDAYRIVAPVHLAFDIHKDKDKFRLVGHVHAELELACSRCVEAYRLPVSAPFDLRYLPASAAIADAEHEMDDEDLETSYYRDDQIDLSELLREQFYLALPMKPLCREDCRGLCPQCGINLNTGACDCAPVWEDSRLAALKGLGRTHES